jgi:hypothetical protein
MTDSRRNARRHPTTCAHAATATTRMRFLGAAALVLLGALALRPAEALSTSERGAGARYDLLPHSHVMQDASDAHSAILSDTDSRSFSGIGMIVCTAGDMRRTSTAFLVGAFDVAVTVAHTFATADGREPECVYNSTDALGQIRERIPVSYIKSQWDSDPTAFGEPASDLAVVRLAEPSRYAQRTMPLGRFSGYAESIVVVGFQQATFPETIKLKQRGHVLGTGRGAEAIARTIARAMDACEIAAGAPIIDERSGIVIGIHAQSALPESSLPTVITMNDWLEATLRAELRTPAAQAAPARADASGRDAT